MYSYLGIATSPDPLESNLVWRTAGYLANMWFKAALCSYWRGLQ